MSRGISKSHTDIVNWIKKNPGEPEASSKIVFGTAQIDKLVQDGWLEIKKGKVYYKK